MRKLHLDELKKGLSGVTEAFGIFLAEAAMFCLEENGHRGTAVLAVSGDFQEDFLLVWTDNLTEEVKSSWVDTKEAVEYGATGIAMLTVLALTKFDVFRRTRGGTDYILTKSEDAKFSEKSETCYLEISGILKETASNTLNMRVSLKEKQVQKTVDDASAFVIVTEFSQPKTKISRQ